MQERLEFIDSACYNEVEKDLDIEYTFLKKASMRIRELF